MRIWSGLLATLGALFAASVAMAQPGPPPGFREGPPETADEFAARMLKFDKDKDGKLTKAEIGDERLFRLFDRADADKDGVVTKAELTALATKEMANDRNGPGGFGPPGGPGGPPGMFGMGPPRPGVILAPPLRRELKLSAEQEKQLDELQKEVDARLDKILTDAQRKQLQDMRRRGPGGPPGGPGGPGRRPPGGRPPGGGATPPPRPE
jgi:hypothetical protein